MPHKAQCLIVTSDTQIHQRKSTGFSSFTGQGLRCHEGIYLRSLDYTTRVHNHSTLISLASPAL